MGKNKHKDNTSQHGQKKPCGTSAQQSPDAAQSLRIKHLTRVLDKVDSGDADDSEEQSTLKTRVQLADLLLEMGSARRAADVLSKHGLHLKGAIDPLLARHRLAPLLLRAGREHEAVALLERWALDRSTIITVCRLLSSLSAWMGGAPSTACVAALAAALEANPALCWILGAPRVRQVLCKLDSMPPELVREVRERRAHMRTRTDPVGLPAQPSASPRGTTSGTTSAASGTSSDLPVAGGLEEALALVTGPFDGWASCPVNGTAISKGQAQPWGAGWVADAGGADTAGPGDVDADECMSPQVDLLCALLVRHHSHTAPLAATCAKRGDGKKAVECMDKVLQAATLAVRSRAKALGECFGEEEEEAN